MNRQERIKKLVEITEAQLGKPYQYGAYAVKETDNNPKIFDCSSFVQFCFKNINFSDFPRSSIEQAAYKGEEIESIEKAQIGDLIFFEGERGHYNNELFSGRKLLIGHVAIYLGNNKIINAINHNNLTGVISQQLSDIHNYPNWPNNIVMIKRYF